MPDPPPDFTPSPHPSFIASPKQPAPLTTRSGRSCDPNRAFLMAPLVAYPNPQARPGEGEEGHYEWRPEVTGSSGRLIPKDNKKRKKNSRLQAAQLMYYKGQGRRRRGGGWAWEERPILERRTRKRGRQTGAWRGPDNRLVML
ncbi:hypothetical protein DPEC_G00195590 [Dallia pectoralis]|uniref:Uncharacterized protein n=1 Tax=Dallia pectoralis TaxID=75939 RepID=A0ACC2G7P6_DALPE|nr:hypothetical protein DPEC_G00195590 [Dallia pectoralis]